MQMMLFLAMTLATVSGSAQKQTVRIIFTGNGLPSAPPAESKPLEPICNYSTHDYKLVENQMTCVARDPNASEVKCSVTSANDTHVIFPHQ